MIKNLLFTAFGFLVIGNSLQAQTRATRTTVMNGTALNPLTWDCTCIPVAGDNIIINHALTLNTDFAYTSGSVTVNASGSMIGDVPTRAFAYTGGSFSNSGTVNVGNFYHGGGTFNNTGSFTIGNAYAVDGSANTVNSGTFIVSDTLYINTGAMFTNSGNTNATYTATAGTIINTGGFNGIDIYNSGTLNNNAGVGFSLSNMYTNGNVFNYAPIDLVFDLWNSENFTNDHHIVVGRNYWNGDTILGTATFTNNGTISVGNDLSNSELMNGTGDYCVANATNNSSNIGGTLDICDLTGGGFDLNIGTIAGTVTFCSAGSCSIGIDEAMNSDAYKIFPNPFNNVFTIDVKTSGEYKFLLLNSFGQIVLKNSFNGTQKLIDLSSQTAGVYHYRIVGENKVMSGKVVKE
jgi:hypothetical protein